MTVKEVRALLVGPANELEVNVNWEGEDFDITEPSPVSEAFANYEVDAITCSQPFKFRLILKQVYVKKEEGAV